MKRNLGFTLIELMIVVAIIAVIAAIAVPSLLRSRIGANESSAIGSLRTLTAAETTWHAANGSYSATLADLSGADPAYIDDALGSGSKSGYDFTEPGGDETAWTCTATPVTSGKSGIRTFFCDESGIIRLDDAAGAPIG